MLTGTSLHTSQRYRHSYRKSAITPRFLRLSVLNTPGFVTSCSKGHTARPQAASPGRAANLARLLGGGTPSSARRILPTGGDRIHLLQFDLCSTFCSDSTQAETQVPEGAGASHAPLRSPEEAGLCPSVSSAAATPGSSMAGGGGGSERKSEENENTAEEREGQTYPDPHPLPPPLLLSPPLLHFPTTPRTRGKGDREAPCPPRPGTGQTAPLPDPATPSSRPPLPHPQQDASVRERAGRPSARRGR